MRLPLVRLALAAASVLVVLSCDTAPVQPRFGNGIAGGPTGSGPVAPVNPGAPDTNSPFVRIDTPATPGQLVNVGDSILVVTRIIDERQIVSLELTGIRYIGSASLGTLTEVVRYSTVTVPASGAPPFRADLVDTTIRRYLKSAVPVDSTIDSMVIYAVARDLGGNVDTARRRVNLVRGPNVVINTPLNGDSVPQSIGMAISARVQHSDGVRDVTVRVQGGAGWPTLLDTSMVTTITGTIRDVTVNHVVTIPANAPVFNPVTITAIANDINRNPGSATPVVVIVRALGTSTPRVTQVIPVRLEVTDSVTVNATGDGIRSLGFIIRDSIGGLVRRDSVVLAAPYTSNAQARLALNLPPSEQGRRMSISSFAVDQGGTTGYSVAASFSGSQSNAALAHNDTTLIVFGRTYRLPRPGVVGDIAVDAARGNIFVSNMSFNRLEVWQASTQTFYGPGIAVGSQPWGLSTLATTPDSLFVANSGGTNLSKVFIGTTNPALMVEDLANRLRTRTAPLFEVLEVLDQATNRLSVTVSDAMLFSNRPQYVGQINSGRVFFSTRPTSVATRGMIHHFDPSQAFPDLKHVIRYQSAPNRPNFIVSGADSIFVRQSLATSLAPDTIVLYDHTPGTAAQSDSVTSTTGMGSAMAAMRALNGSDVSAIQRADPNSIGYTDTSFVAVSGDRNWIAFGNGNTAGPGFIFMASPTFFSPIFTQVDLTNNASERVFGLALDSTGVTVAGHGAESYFASVDVPFHLRLQGKFNTFTTGAGIAFHPGARGASTPNPFERLAFVASDDASIEVLDIAHFLSAGRLVIKEKLYGPIRVSRRFATDPANVVAKIYGVTQNGGLVVIDVVDANVTPVP